MDYDELKEAVFSIIKDDDPYKASTVLNIKIKIIVFYHSI